MGERSKRIACDAYEEVDKAAKDAWERLKKAHKKKDSLAVEEAVKDFSEAMELVYEVWPSIVEKLGIDMEKSASKTAFFGGYSEATRGYCLSEDLGVKRGDNVATRTMYKVRRIFPWKR